MSKGLYVKVNDTFYYDGNYLRCIKDKSVHGNCKKCFFFEDSLCHAFQCTTKARKDGISVIAKLIRRKRIIKVEDVCDKLIKRYSNKDTIKSLKFIKSKFKELINKSK